MIKNSRIGNRTSTVRKLILASTFWAGIFGSGLAPIDGEAFARTHFDGETIKQIVVQEAAENRTVPPALALAVAKVESDFRANANSHAGARGVMQIMPATGYGEFGVSADDLWDPRLNARIGIAFLERLYQAYGDWHLVLSHYNGGSLKRKGGKYQAHSYTRKYVADVMYWWNHFEKSRVITALQEVAKPTTQVVSRSGNPNGNWATRQNSYASGYWVLEDPSHKNSWKQYLATADLWLDRIQNRSEQDYEDDPLHTLDPAPKPRFRNNTRKPYDPLQSRFN